MRSGRSLAWCWCPLRKRSESREANDAVEVATFRSDIGYSDGRHPDHVRYSQDAREDVERRDFTINGMLLDPMTDEVLDYVGGRDDLKAGIVRTIGDPERRFGEDKLRMLRAVRFAARFDYTIEPATFAAIQKLAFADSSGFAGTRARRTHQDAHRRPRSPGISVAR